MKNIFKKFIKRLADENSKTFSGSGKLDCCSLNRENNTKKDNKKNK
ncbi:hypothetical protein BD780_001401 [Clostridium tetanomorphum]|uniref:Uncharacterized protein n=1 Tax=Clostridium tetanomorphum TaxID=1553 RepID=A0A923EAH6_CLOTT|nr:LDCC motif putative metal-binding protein [Clostridium tetanomorphum]MBC2398136.1 hypothetical protein [Clostridium tetanomorphum]MBP1866497.1 hypothetical protein [Clostridium tetanomorphum]NRS84176.1 hypothetical protein [Clostridium tetanomorphum]NRZ97388.1 hypothetical protein [Clostridium tetanomorphum]SQB92602.1 Uncharacterised protein [Clostridium tetanomorphum]